ncbi:MAG: deoxyribodipyrimidine photo-lyase [Chloroflexi bacterium]|nr:deoxyribodipyrimidine photo-lyase [Chloroflexota bacterium]
MQRIIWWLRRDLRLTDNITLHYALRDASSVIPVFILDPRLLNSHKLAPARKQFLFDTLADLDSQLRKHNSRLILRRGEPARELSKLAKETQANAVYFHRDHTPYARRRDTQVVSALNVLGVRIEQFDDNYLAAPEQVLKDDGTPYTVFTPYRNRFEQVVVIPNRFSTRGQLNTPRDIPSLDIPTIKRNDHFARGGETEALKLARAFMRRDGGLHTYRDALDRRSAGVDFRALDHRARIFRSHQSSNSGVGIGCDGDCIDIESYSRTHANQALARTDHCVQSDERRPGSLESTPQTNDRRHCAPSDQSNRARDGIYRRPRWSVVVPPQSKC